MHREFKSQFLNPLLTLLVLFFAVTGTAIAWVHPIGIPSPKWEGGIHSIDEPQPELPSNWTGDVDGFYYVRMGASGSGNGNPTAPIGSLPSSAGPGDVIVIEGDVTVEWYLRNYTGSATHPVWIISSPTNKARFLKKINLFDSGYLIFDDVITDSADNVSGGKFFLRENIHHLTIRNSSLNGYPVRGGGGIIGAGNNIVIYNNEIANSGDAYAVDEDDTHAVSINGSASYNWWVVDNHIHHSGGDSVQSKTGAHHIYIGRNVMHEDRENAVDIKEGHDIIISQNTMYGYRRTNSSPGSAVTIHYEPTNIWVIANTIYDTDYAGINSTGCTDCYVVGNVIYDIRENSGESHGDCSAYRSGIGIQSYTTLNWYVINNTILNSPVGIGSQLNLDNAKHYYENNIVSGTPNSTPAGLKGYDMIINGSSTPTNASSVKNNLLDSSDSDRNICWRNSDYTISELRSYADKCESCIGENPQFYSVTTPDLRISSTSPARDGGITSTVYSRFQTLYGIDIKADLLGHAFVNERDIGAYEFSTEPAGSNKAPPSPPIITN